MKTTTILTAAAFSAALILTPLTSATARDSASEMFSGMMRSYTSQPASAASKNFVKKATIGGMFEVESSQLALERSRNKSVRNFAEEMVDDHTEANEDLKDAVTSSGVNPATIPTRLDAKHRVLLNNLKKADGRAFDQQYIAAQVDGHKDAVALFTDYSRNGDDPVLREFAGDILPTLRDHKRKIMEIKDEKPTYRDWKNSDYRDWRNPDYR